MEKRANFTHYRLKFIPQQKSCIVHERDGL